MVINKALFIALAVLVSVFCIGAGSDIQAQGKGKGKPSSAGNSGAGGSNRGGGNSEDRVKGNSTGAQNTSSGSSTRAGNNEDRRNDRAEIAREKASKISDNELNRYRGVSKKIGTTPEKMRAYYESALLTNPNLKYGNFIAANVIADNMQDRHPAITSDAILAGLANGDSLGQTLQNLGLSKDQANAAKRNAEDHIKATKHRNK